MSKGIKAGIVVGLTALAVSIGAGGALAAPPKGGGPIKAAATYIGVTVEQLREQLKAGKSLAQVATASGKSVDGLKAALIADAKQHLDQAVADGKLTSAQAAERLSKLQSNVDRIVNATGPPQRGGGGKGKGGRKGPAAVARAAAKITSEYTGLSLDQVREQLKAGKSLAQIATGANKSVDGLKQAILTKSKATIDKLVADGKLTAERAQRYYDELVEHIDDLVNKTRPARQ